MGKHKSHKVHKNSKASYALLRFGRRNTEIREVLSRVGPSTDREIMQHLGKADPNYVRSFITRMRDRGAVRETGTKVDAQTNRPVRVVEIILNPKRKTK